MKILVSGSTGLIGSELVSFLNRQGNQVVRLVRRPPAGDEIQWEATAGGMESGKLEGFDAVVHLAGDPIAQGRWTPAKKARIRDSRVQGTQLLAESLAQLTKPPKAFVCASAIGYYGDRGDELLTEESSPGNSFLGKVGQEWEQASQPAAQKGIRVVNLRFGIVMSPKGGALKMMLPPFRMGAGSPLGSGRQTMSWVSLEDVVGAIHHALTHESLRGAVNVVAPNPVTNLQFTKTLGKVLRRPTLFPVPAFAVRLLFGEMADEALLASTRVAPMKLKATGFSFKHPELEGMLRAMLKT